MRFAVFLATLTLLATAPLARPVIAPHQDDEEMEEVFAEVKELMLRLPLRYHVQAWEILAKTEDPRGIQELARMYAKPKVPKDQSRYLLASALGEKGGGQDIVETLAEWRGNADESEDAWLWRHALRIEVDETSADVALEIARTAKDVTLRAAAIEALAANKDESLYTLIPELVKAMPKKDVDKMMLMGAMATVLTDLGNKKTRVETEWKLMALSLIALLDDEKFPSAAKLVLARHLAEVLDAERVVLEGNAWRTLIAERSREAKEKKSKRRKKKNQEPEYVRPNFFGVEVTGQRVCYLIDLSDSMAESIPDDWRPDGAPTSGPSGKKRKWKKGEIPTNADIPWYSIDTRFDLAREHLRISLMRLEPDQKFTVIGFGTMADYMDGAEGMVKASPSNIKKVIKALDKIEIGSPQGERIHGTLWGDTNMHAGLNLAYATCKKGEVKGAPYIDAEAFASGADTLFILSDGNPSVDDFTVKDTDYGDGTVITDAESGNEADERTAELNYMGPYSNWKYLLDDVSRMNMLRELEIHVISVGDGDEVALGMLAKIGFGQFKVFGKKDKK